MSQRCCHPQRWLRACWTRAISISDSYLQKKRALANAKLCSLAANVPYNVPNVTEAVTQSVEHGQEEAAAAPAQSAKDSAATAMALILGENYFSSALTSCETEVKNFLSDSPIGLEMSPVDWWKLNASRFPRLANLAKQYLCIPGTSVPSERVFSAAGLTVNRLRTSLTPDHVDMLIFLNKN